VNRHHLNRYRAALSNLIECRSHPRLAERALARETNRIGGNPATPLLVLARSHVHAIVGALATAELEAEAARTWARAVFERLAYLDTGGSPVAAEISYRFAIYNTVEILAADPPPFTLDTEGLARLDALLECPDVPEDDGDWDEDTIAAFNARQHLLPQGTGLDLDQIQQHLETAILEADIRGIPDPQPVPFLLAVGRPQPGEHLRPPLGEGETDMLGFDLCDQSWMIRPGPAPGIAALYRASKGRLALAAHLVHDKGTYERLLPIPDSDPAPPLVIVSIPIILADARVSGLRL
jgi:hypothetical protein